MRCARTDKGVHAAGNVISLKLIIEDPEVIPKINANLPEQIRVWDIIRTIGSFSCYQLCDSRKYEYLVPSHVFLPPYPDSYLAKICLEYAEKEGDLENYLTRQKEVEGWWPAVNAEVKEQLGDLDQSVVGEAMAQGAEPEKPPPEGPEPDDGSRRTKQENPLRKKLQEIHLKEKKAYRIPAERLERVREAFRQFVGTNNFYNFTIDKSFKDASAKRHIKSFEVWNRRFLVSVALCSPCMYQGQRSCDCKWHRMALHSRARTVLHDAPNPQNGGVGDDGGPDRLSGIPHPGGFWTQKGTDRQSAIAGTASGISGVHSLQREDCKGESERSARFRKIQVGD